MSDRLCLMVQCAQPGSRAEGDSRADTWGIFLAGEGLGESLSKVKEIVVGSMVTPQNTYPHPIAPETCERRLI